MTLSAHAIPGIPLVKQGDDLSTVVFDACRKSLALEAHDIVVVTGKVVSKSEGRIVDLRSVEPSERARRLADLTEKDPRLVELVLRESVDVVRARPGNLLVRHRLGYVSAVAGVDRSNVDGDPEHALLLPADPGASARSIRDGLRRRAGVDVGVIISDSHGRPFRIGNTGIAIGSAGVQAVRYLEGRSDLFGHPLTAASIVPVADLIASTAMLLSGEASEGFPVVVVRGVSAVGEEVDAGELIRPAERDMFGIPDRDYA